MSLRLASVFGGLLGLAGVAGAAPFPGVWLPRHGEGYLVPDTWADRGLRYGREALVGLIERAAARVAEDEPGSTLYVGDLSLKSGSWTEWHRSHGNGIDGDLLFFAVDDDGNPAPPPSRMITYDASGVGIAPDGSRLHFDVARNWALVRALITDDTPVSVIFVSWPLRAMLLAYARDTDEPAALIDRAAEVLAQPGDSAAHDDHFHVRIVGPANPEPARPRVYARSGNDRPHVKPAHHARHGQRLALKHKKKAAKRRRT